MLVHGHYWKDGAGKEFDPDSLVRRNREFAGVSHAPDEYATDADCAAGVDALAAVLEELACR